jgi:molecular chaperone GrpE (heat shock protein)
MWLKNFKYHLGFYMVDNGHDNNAPCQCDNKSVSGQGETEKQCCQDLKDIKDRYIYLTAEFDNYKKRMEKERGQWIASAQAMVLKDILPIVDDFERALQQLQAQKLPSEIASHLAGIELIAKSLQKLLKKYDVQEITDVTTFDPEFHEAIMQVKSDQPSGSIVSVFQKGYKHKGQVLRPAQVSVAE